MGTLHTDKIRRCTFFFRRHGSCEVTLYADTTPVLRAHLTPPGLRNFAFTDVEEPCIHQQAVFLFFSRAAFVQKTSAMPG